MAFECIRRIKLWKIPDYFDVENILSLPKTNYDIKRDIGSLSLRALLGFYKRIAIKQNSYVCKSHDKNKILFFYGNWWYRESHLQILNNFASHFSDADLVVPQLRKTIQITPFRCINCLFCSCVWFFQLIRNCTFYETITAIPYLQAIVDVLNWIKDYSLDKYMLIVVFNDLSPSENALVQYAKHVGMKTATLQHGMFTRREPIFNLSDTGFQYYCSPSDDFLAWNNFSRDEALHVGVKQDKIKVLGIPQAIDFCNPDEISCNNDIIGVVLSGILNDGKNEKLITMAEQLANYLNMKYTLRYHPNTRVGMYDYMCGERYVRFESDMSLREYMGSVSFTIITDSTVFVECLRYHHPVFRLSISEHDTYSSVRGCSFTNISSFLDAYNNYEKEYSEIYDYLCGPKDVYLKYREYFDGIVK